MGGAPGSAPLPSDRKSLAGVPCSPAARTVAWFEIVVGELASSATRKVSRETPSAAIAPPSAPSAPAPSLAVSVRVAAS